MLLKDKKVKDDKEPLLEIKSMHLVWESINEDEEMIMLVCATSKEYFVYNEEDTEESQLLRRVQGGLDDEISVMAYDFHLSIVATGGVSGDIAIYDFEMSKLLAILVGH